MHTAKRPLKLNVMQMNIHKAPNLIISPTRKVFRKGGVGCGGVGPREYCSASPRHGLDQVVNHLRWDGHPLVLECLKQLTHICGGVHSTSNTSLQLVPSVFVWV